MKFPKDHLGSGREVAFVPKCIMSYLLFCVSGTVCSFIAESFLCVVWVGCRGARILCGTESSEQYNKETRSSKEKIC